MPLIPKIFLQRAPEAKASAAKGLIALQRLGAPAWTPRDYASLARQGYEKNVIAYRCVRLVSEAAASAPLKVVEDGAVLCDHPLIELLARPNPAQSGAELLESFYGFLQTAGNAYLEAVALDGTPRELYALRPDRMKARPGKSGWPESYEYSAGGRKVVFAKPEDGASPILHLKLFHPTNDYYGFSTLEAAASSVDLHNAASAWNKALLDNAGRPLVLDGGLEWRSMSLSPSDMDFIDAKNMAAREIALAFGVPPMLLGIPGDNTYPNYREANLAFWKQTVLPLVKKTAAALTGWLAPAYEGAQIICQTSEIDALAAERDAAWARISRADFLTDDEKRAALGFPALDEDARGDHA